MLLSQFLSKEMGNNSQEWDFDSWLLKKVVNAFKNTFSILYQRFPVDKCLLILSDVQYMFKIALSIIICETDPVICLIWNLIN